MKELKVEAKGDREIIMTRVFNASRDLVYDCFTKPELLKRWLYGPEGWSLAECEVDLRVGGKYRYLWRHIKTGEDMGAGGVYKEIQTPEKIVCTEAFDESWYPGESILTNLFIEKAGKTTFHLTILYESQEARDIVIKSPMEGGAGQSYDRLASLLKELSA
ncbi:SRPBCC family protein [Leptospira wolffii]|uniref:SRPBCC family protein n=1 Tax=Leptospira wolffii TaxID=409998 RepID=A0ABV5BQA3_9LEPT|nr:SRPBCC family protein [Leptospira wolffii]TGL45726.1 ATPase [Leptospira wolffii]